MLSFFHTIIYIPIYNLLIFLVDVIPGGDIGLAVIIATLIVKLLIMPLSFSALRTQRAMRIMEPELKHVKEAYKDDKETQAKEMFALYKKYGVNPFAGLLVLIIQLPILLTLFWVFHSSTLLTVNTSILYSFVPVPEAISPLFLGIFAVTGASIVLAILTAVTQFIQAWYTIPMPPAPAKDEKPSMQADIGRAMAIQMRYILPIIMGAVAYASVALALYFITTNVVGIVQEFIIRRKPIVAQMIGKEPA